MSRQRLHTIVPQTLMKSHCRPGRVWQSCTQPAGTPLGPHQRTRGWYAAELFSSTFQRIAECQRAQRYCVVQLALSEPGKRVELQVSLIRTLVQCKEWKRAEEQLLQALGSANDQRAVPLLRQLVDVQVHIPNAAWHRTPTSSCKLHHLAAKHPDVLAACRRSVLHMMLTWRRHAAESRPC